ncbi:MAG: hypothetical protein ACPGYV_10950 [Phycisphaeraceae bacterium]
MAQSDLKTLETTYQRIAMAAPAWRREDGPAGRGDNADRPTLHEAVTAQTTDLRGLEDVKAYAKGHYLLNKDLGPDDRTAYLAIYLTAIAAALRWHATSITSLPVVPLASALVWASNQPWLPVESRRLCDPKRLIDALIHKMTEPQPSLEA